MKNKNKSRIISYCGLWVICPQKCPPFEINASHLAADCCYAADFKIEIFIFRAPLKFINLLPVGSALSNRRKKKTKINKTASFNLASYVFGKNPVLYFRRDDTLVNRIFEWIALLLQADNSHNGTTSINKFVCTLHLIFFITLILSSFSCMRLRLTVFAFYMKIYTV